MDRPRESWGRGGRLGGRGGQEATPGRAELGISPLDATVLDRTQRWFRAVPCHVRRLAAWPSVPETLSLRSLQHAVMTAKTRNSLPA